MQTFYVTAPNKRPDIRLIQAFLWGDDENIDSEGNAISPASNTWTELTLIPRDKSDAGFDVTEHKVFPLILKVCSEKKYIAARVAYLLAWHMKGKVAETEKGPYKQPEMIVSELGQDFDLKEAFARFRNSPFVKASLENPYPNLGKNQPVVPNPYNLIWREWFWVWTMRLIKIFHRG
ncbi:MAG: hypothetical protein L6R45_08825 [Anaerolineae bacterium]|nr:hypothetical protein [Anaerolineae bacterium]